MSNSLKPSAWQESFTRELRQLARDTPDLLKIRAKRRPDGSGNVQIDLRIDTSSIEVVEGGLQLAKTEDVEVIIFTTDARPPSVCVSHGRFVGYPHVLQGVVLCTYLDASREWDPAAGATEFMNRLWSWFEEAAAAKFDSANALYHAVGGTNHTGDSGPLAVFREEVPAQHGRVTFKRRSAHRFDVRCTATGEGVVVPLWCADAALPLGAGLTLHQLGKLLDDPQLNGSGFTASDDNFHGALIQTSMQAAAKRNKPDTSQPFALSVPHPAGGAPHVLVGEVNAISANALRQGKHRPNAVIDWWRVSDERPSVTRRRDSSRPISAFAGKTVLLFGCGGLGSWIAEFLVRAGVDRLIISDPSTVTGGLLVRQNFTESNLGESKELALRQRLLSIGDDVVVDLVGEIDDDMPDRIDLIIDATVSVAMAQKISTQAAAITTAQVAVDPATGSYGLVLVSAGADAVSIGDVDSAAGAVVACTYEYEAYSHFWSTSDADMLVPTRGCSVPTFHGSAADLAAVAGVMASILGSQVVEPQSGAHLFCLPHTAAVSAPSSVFIPVAPGAVLRTTSNLPQ